MYKRFHKLNKQSLMWFSPLLALPVLWLQLPPHPHQTPPQAQKPNSVASPAAFSVQVSQKAAQLSSSGTSGKSVSSKSALQKSQQSPKKVAATKSSPKSKAKPRPYTAPTIEIRVALAQNANGLAIASSTRANISDVNGRRVDQLPPGQAFQAVASNSTIASSNWQTLQRYVSDSSPSVRSVIEQRQKFTLVFVSNSLTFPLSTRCLSMSI